MPNEEWYLPGEKPIKYKVGKQKFIHRKCEFDLPTEEDLKKYPKDQLTAEIIRVYGAMKNMAIELGIAPRNKSGELSFDMQFVSHVITILKISWSSNLD